MEQKYVKQNLIFVFVFIFSFCGFAQKQQSIWSSVDKNTISKSQLLERTSSPSVHKIFNLNIEALRAILTNAPKREQLANSNVIVDFPKSDGTFESFRIYEASNMAPELQAQFPEIRSYIGKSLTNPSSILRFSISPQKGLSTMLLNDGKTVFIEPFTKDLNNYIVFINSKGDKNTNSFVCETEDFAVEFPGINDNTANRNADDGQLRTFRLALACTGEYAQFHGGTVPGVMAAMDATMARVNGVFERDLAVTMQIVPTNTNVIFLNAGTDPYTNNSGFTMLGENQATCDANIGSANYDIGHVFSTGGGGVAQVNSPCTGNKARGVTGSGFPQGDTFDIDYVAHEMGHQYGAGHTQNNPCQISSASSMEPGSASTIMGYAGICAPNVQNNSDDYFHTVSIIQMWNNVSAGASQCGAQSPTGNTAPVANAGPDYNIPKSTAFVLRGSGSDANPGDVLTYCWEQFDNETTTHPPQSNATQGPVYRSLDPTTSPDRYMPAYNTVRNGSLQSTWEVTPSVGRTMSFVLTVRDNVLMGASTDSDLMIVNVEDVDPFTVNTPPAWGSGSTQTLTWNEGSTTNGTINCQSVNILFSIDGGISFPYTLASGTPNDGSQQITVPSVADTSNARIMVEAADNIFYALSDNFSISNSPDFGLTCSNPSQNGGCGTDSVIYNLDYTTVNGFNETTTFSAVGMPAGTSINFTPTSLNATGSFTFEVSGLNSASDGNYNIVVTGTSTSLTRTVNLSLGVNGSLCASVGDETDTYLTSTTGVTFNTINNLNNNPGGDNGYSNFTGLSTDVNRESNYNLSVNVNTDGPYPVETRVWIDWNQNCVFDANEEYNLGDAFGTANGPTSNSPLSIMIPNDAALGQTTMRVTTKYNAAPTACENDHDGETEDYTVNVQPSLSVDEETFTNFNIYPNPNKGEFTIQLTSLSTSDINVDIFDIRGRKIYNESFDNTSELIKTISLNNAQAGMYLVVVNDGERKATKKIIVE